MTKICRLMVAVISGGVLLGVQAGAAEPGAEPAGPMDLGVSFRAEYTDNRDASEIEEENTDFYVTPRIHFYARTERALYDLHYAPSFRYRTDPAESENDNELLHDLGVRVDFDASERTKLRLIEKFDYQDDPSVESGAVRRSDRSYIRNRIEAGAVHELNRWTFGDVMGAYEFKSYDEQAVADESDEDRAEARVTLTRWVTKQTALHGIGSYSMYGYESTRDIDRDVDVALGAVGAEKVFSPELRAGLEVGAQAVEYSDGELDSEIFPYGKLTATLSPTPASRLNGTLTHGVRDSDVFPFASQEYSELRLAAEVDPTSPLSLGLSLTLRESEYNEDSLPVSGAGAPLTTEGDETTTAVSAYAEWTLTDAARLVIRQTYEDVDSDVDVSFTKNTSGLELHLDL